MAGPAAAASTALKGLHTCIQIAETIADLIEKAEDNDGRLHNIIDHSTIVKKLLIQANELQLSEAVRVAIETVERKLKKCDDYINQMMDRSLPIPKDFLLARKYNRDLEKLEKELEGTITYLTLSFVVQNTAHLQNRFLSLSDQKTGPIPGKARDLEAPRRAHNRIMLTWRAPIENLESVRSYEVNYRRKGKLWENIVLKISEVVAGDEDKFSVVVNGLSSDTYYWFRVRAFNDCDYPGRFSEYLLTETKYNPHFRRFIATGVGIGATLGAPFLVAGTGAILSGGGVVLGATDENTSATEAATMTTAGVAMTASTPILGTIGAPVVGAAVAFLVNSDMKDDEF